MAFHIGMMIATLSLHLQKGLRYCVKHDRVSTLHNTQVQPRLGVVTHDDMEEG